jgi:flagellar hook-associated protein 1 FlgK
MGTGIFSLGIRAMSASQAMLDTVSHNISNANTPGYSRQEVQLETEGGMFTGAGFYGRGVKVATVSRVSNEFLIKEANTNGAASASDSARLDKLKQLEKVLPTGESGLGYAASQVLNAFVDVANQPQDMSARQVALARAQEWVSRSNNAGLQLNDLQSGVVSDMTTSVGQINTLTKQIAVINDSIAKYTGSGHAPNDLLDQRDQLVKQLNKQVQVTTVAADDGTMSVFMGGGQLLVLGNTAQSLSVVRDPTNAAQARVSLDTGGSSRILDSSQMTGGALKGLLQFQDNDLVDTRAQLNSFTASFANAVNQQQSLGLDANGTPQTSFDASGNPVGTAIFLNTGTAEGISLSLNTPKGIAAASPLVASVNTTNKGTLSVDSVTMMRAVPTGTAPDASTSLPVTGDALTVVFEQDPADATKLTYRFTDSNGNPYKDVSPARAWQPGVAISDTDAASTPSTPLFNVNLSGVPKAGDKLTVATTTYPGSNNGNALAMLKLRDKAFATLDGSSFATVTDSYSQMIGNLGVIVQAGQTSANISSSLAADSEQTLSSTSGVNLDEEAARLIQYQQSYQAAAKVMQVAQSLFDTLLQTAGR